MKRIGKFFAVMMIVACLAEAAEAQWVYRPVAVAPRGVTRVYRRPTVFYQPTTMVYSRRRPILGGYSVRTRPAYRRTVVW